MSAIAWREDWTGREHDGLVGPATAALDEASQRKYAGCADDYEGNEENGSETTGLHTAGRVFREQGNEGGKQEQGGTECEFSERKPGMRLRPAGLAEVGHGVVSAALAAGAVFGCVVLFSVERALAQRLAPLAAYPCFGALFHVGYRRWDAALARPFPGGTR